MIRLLHFADLHLGVENYGHLDPVTGLNSRLGDFLRAFDAIVDYALSNDIHLVLFAGDAYKGRNPTPTHQREFAKRIQRLVEGGIPTFLLVGNHDMPRALGRATSVEIFQTLEVANVHVAPRPATHLIETKGGSLQIVALPWVTLSHTLTREEHRGKSLQEIEGLIAQKIENIIEEEVARLDPRWPAILVAHGSVFGAVYGSERSVILGQETIIPRSAVKNPAFAYVALGHIHRHQVLSEEPPVVYAGSVERVDFGEESEPKGFVVVEMEGARARWEFVPLEARPFLTIRVEATGSDPTAQILEAISEHRVKGAVVRLLIQTTAEAAPLIRDKELLDSLSPAFHLAAISKEVERSPRLRLGPGSVEGLTPQEALKRYLEVKKVSPERAEVLLRYARELEEETGGGGS